MNNLEQRTQAIIEACVKEKETNPLAIFRHVAGQESVRIHGPEHHVLDGACLLTALRNVGMEFDLPELLTRLRQEGLQMPGAICGHWGVCGAVASLGAALALLEGTGPLSADLKTAIPYVKERFGITLPEEKTVCGFYPKNEQCLGERCPYNPGYKK